MKNKLPTSYDEQQAELQRMEAGEKIVVEAPKEPEVNPEVYRDVEDLLFHGFLTQSCEVNDVEFVFKTLNHHEHELIRLTGGYDEKGSPTKRFWSQFIAYSTFMVGGINILPERNQWIPRLTKEYGEIILSVKMKIVRYLSELNRRARKAITLVECYALEKYSRYRWLQVLNTDMTSPSITGIAGTDQLGMNWGQLTWRAINRIDDLRDILEQQWEHAKFIGSCSAGKEIQKVYTKDSERRRQERTEQLSRKDAVLRHVLLGEPLHDKALHKAGAVWVTAQTVEDLAQQLQSDLRGEKDWHDVVVDTYENRMKDAQKAKEEQVKELHAQREIEFGGKSLIGGTDMSGLTPAEVRDAMIRRRQFQVQVAEAQAKKLPPQSRAVRSDFEEIETRVGTTDQDPSTARPITPARTPQSPPFSVRRP
jgi:hypothetical protein